MDMEFGPDGALYVLEYGDGYFAENPDAQLSRIDFIGAGGNRSPVPAVSATPTNGTTPLTVSFTSDGTVDPDGDRIRYSWDFDGDGDVDSHAQDPTHTYRTNGVYRATLTVTDVGGRHRGRHASADVDIVVGNQAPTVELVAPVAGQPFEFGDTVQFEVNVADDQPVDCNAVTVTYVLGHDDHGHPQTTASGCTGSIDDDCPERARPGGQTSSGRSSLRSTPTPVATTCLRSSVATRWCSNPPSDDSRGSRLCREVLAPLLVTRTDLPGSHSGPRSLREGRLGMCFGYDGEGALQRSLEEKGVSRRNLFRGRGDWCGQPGRGGRRARRPGGRA